MLLHLRNVTKKSMNIVEFGRHDSVEVKGTHFRHARLGYLRHISFVAM